MPEELVAAIGIAAAKSREPITLMVPLVWLAAHDGQVPAVAASAVPSTFVLDDIPLYALDKHTRIGLEAVRSLVKYNSAIRDFLERHVAPGQRHKAAYMAAFYADAAPLASKLSWDGADRLEALVLLSQSVAAFVEKNHIFEKTHFFSIRRLRWV